jgi:hypothetical protein
MSWIPRGEGKGGTFTNASYHDMVKDSTYKVTSAYVQHNAWLPEGTYVNLQNALVNPVTSLHIFNRYSGLTQTLSSQIICGVPATPAVYNSIGPALIRGAATPMPLTGNGRFCFATVKNRLYMANGTDAPAISAAATASSCIPWGFAAQAPNLGYQIAAVGTGTNATVLGGTQGTCNTTAVANSVCTWVSGPNFQYLKVGQVIYVNGVFWTINTWVSNTQITLSGNAGALAGVPFSANPTGLSGAVNVTGSVPGPALNTFTNFNGAAGPVLNTGAVVAGNPIYVSTGASGVTPTVKYTVASITGAYAGTTTVVNAEAVGAVTRAGQINFGNIAFEGASYLYGVSYYNPTSGHVSNLSPILSVKDGAPLNSNVSITLSNIVATNDTSYTKIIIWRSAKGGSNLFPLAVLNNDTGNTAGNTITYTDTLSDDTALGTVANGPGKVVAPRGENAQPPSDLNFIAYWDGRFWGASQTQIGLLFFSGRSAGNNEDVSVGVPEECWPTNFTRVIPESDGRITGLRTVGNNLFVLTDNNIYAVIGNSRDTYGLTRVSAKGNGTSHFATCVLPAEDTNSTDVLVHFGNDSRLYFLFGSGGDFPVSYAIQDQLAGIAASQVSVGLLHAYQTTYIVLLTPAGQFFYDLERKIWLKEGAFSAVSFFEGLYSGQITPLYGTNAGGVYQGQLSVGSPPAVTVWTNTLSPGEGDRKDDKALLAVGIYYNAPTSITVSAVIDGTTYPCQEVANTGAYSAYFEASDARIFMPRSISGGPTTGMGRLFSFVVQYTPVSFAESLYEIRGLWTFDQSPETAGGNT